MPTSCQVDMTSSRVADKFRLEVVMTSKSQEVTPSRAKPSHRNTIKEFPMRKFINHRILIRDGHRDRSTVHTDGDYGYGTPAVGVLITMLRYGYSMI